MEEIELPIKNVSLKFSDSTIQKYNGKSVPILSLFEPLFCESNVLAIFKVSPFRTVNDIKIRSFLKKRGIKMRRFKLRQFRLLKRILCNTYSEKLLDSVFCDSNFIDFFRFMEGSVVVLEFDDMSHFLFFEKFLRMKLEKSCFSFFSVKVGDQHFLVSSSFFKTALILANTYEYNLSRLKNFNFFQLCVIRNFLYFCVALQYQKAFWRLC